MSTLASAGCGGGSPDATADAQVASTPDAAAMAPDSLPPDAAPIPHRVAGVVMGLVGSLTLSNAETDESLRITENGPVAFAGAVFDGQAFQVVATETPPLQRCELGNGAGTIDGQDASFTVQCDYTALTAPTLAQGFAGNLVDIATPRLAMNDTGRKVRAWLEKVDGNDRVFSMEFDGSNWGTATMRSPGGIDASEIDIAMNRAGDVVLLYKLGGAAVVLSHRKAGTWTDPGGVFDAINPSGSSILDSLTVALAQSGDYFVAYRMTDAGASHVYLHHNKNGTAAESPANLDDYLGPSGNINAQLTLAAGGGKAVLAWMLYDGTVHRLFRSEYNGSQWTHPKLLADAVTAGISGVRRVTTVPVASLNDAGDGVMAFAVHNTSNINRLLVSTAAAGVWSDPANASTREMTSNWESWPGNIYVNAALISDNGDAVVIFSEGNAGRRLYVARHLDGATGWIKPSGSDDNLNLEGDDLAIHGPPFFKSVVAAELDDSGNLILVWAQAGTTDNRAFVAYLNDGQWQLPVASSPLTGVDEVDCDQFQIAFNSAGEAELSMRYADGDAYQIYSSTRR